MIFIIKYVSSKGVSGISATKVFFFFQICVIRFSLNVYRAWQLANPEIRMTQHRIDSEMRMSRRKSQDETND